MFITLIGSTRFEEDMRKEAERLTLQGYNVFELTCIHDKRALNGETKLVLDRLIREKIDISDRVHVINKDGYIGESTKSEIQYARHRHKVITYMEYIQEPIPDAKVEDEIDYKKIDFEQSASDIVLELLDQFKTKDKVLRVAKQIVNDIKLCHIQKVMLLKDISRYNVFSADEIIQSIKKYQKAKEVYLIALGLNKSAEEGV